MHNLSPEWTESERPVENTARLLGVIRSERLNAIVARLESGRSLAVVSLAEEFGVSSATIRRDLQFLEGQRILNRTHGGAVADGVLFELPLRYKSSQQLEEKRRIAAEAASRVECPAVIGMIGGTTTTEVARVLADRTDLTIVTNALNIAAEIAVRPNLRLLVTGGIARPESYELIGPIAEQGVETVNLDIAFIGVDGVSTRAHLTTHHEAEAGIDHALISRAQQVIVVADSSKIGRAAFATICLLDDVDELITDEGADPAEVAALREAGLKVTLV